jgi:hypothetical protein
MRFVGDIALDAEVRAIASGAITDGEPVIVNSAGTVSGVTDAVSLTLGSETEYTSDASNYNSVAFDSNSNRIVIAHKNGSNARGTATVGSVSGTSVTFGTTVDFDDSGEAEFYGITFDSNSNKIVIAYRDTTDSGKGKAVVGTVDPSNNSISFGSQATFTTNSVAIYNACFDTSNNKVVISYTDLGNSSHGTAVVGTVSGTSISFGTPVVFNSANTAYPHTVYDSDAEKVVIAYYDLGNSYNPTGIVGTVSGTGISFGSEATTASVTGGDYIGLAYDSTNNRIVFAYHDNSNSSYGTASVGTVSGTSISFGTPVVFESADNAYIDATFDASTGKVVIAYRDIGNSNYGTYVVGTVSDTSISFGTPATFNTNTEYIGLGYDSNAERVVISYKDAGDGDDGTARILQNAQPTTLTTENFIGFANAAYADGQKATVKTTGSIARNIPQVPSASDSLGSAVVFESGDTYTDKGSVYDSNADRIVIFYRDGDDSSYGKAIVGTVSGNSVTFGTAVTFISEAVSGVTAVFDSNSNKVVVFYKNGADSEGRAHVGTVDPSDNSISFGSEATFNAGNCFEFGAAFDSTNNKIVVSYKDFGNSSYGTAIVGTVSGTSITFGSEVVFNSATTVHTDAVYDPDEGRVVIVYEDSGNSDHGTAIVGTVSGTSISFGSEVVFDNGGDCHYTTATYDTTANKVIVAYEKNYDSSHASAIVGTVSGTSISFGSATEFAAAATNYIRPVYVSHLDKTVIGYQDVANSYKGTYIVGTVSGTSISFNTEAVYTDNAAYFNDILYNPTAKKVIFSYWDDTNNDSGTVTVLSPAGTPEDLTIGQQYFVQTDGTLGTSADDPSVIAGTAIGASDIIVKG